MPDLYEITYELCYSPYKELQYTLYSVNYLESTLRPHKIQELRI